MQFLDEASFQWKIAKIIMIQSLAKLAESYRPISLRLFVLSNLLEKLLLPIISITMQSSINCFPIINFLSEVNTQP